MNYRYGNYLDRFHHLYPNEEIIADEFDPDLFVFYLIGSNDDLKQTDLRDHADPYLLERVDEFVKELFNDHKGESTVQHNVGLRELKNYCSVKDESSNGEIKTHQNEFGELNNEASTILQHSVDNVNPDYNCVSQHCITLNNIKRSSFNCQEENRNDYQKISEYSKASAKAFFEGFMKNGNVHVIDDDDDDNLMIDEGDNV